MEVWKKIEEFEDYEVSNLGRVKSTKYNKEKILKSYDSLGYLKIDLSVNGIKKKIKVHQLVAMAFLNHTPNKHKIIVNHKNHIRNDNRVENLELITQRENTNKKHIKSSSEFVGVCFSNSKQKWRSRITINGKRKELGFFKTEIEAHNAYQWQLSNL